MDQAIGISDVTMMVNTSGGITRMQRISTDTDGLTGAHMIMLRLPRLICFRQRYTKSAVRVSDAAGAEEIDINKTSNELKGDAHCAAKCSGSSLN